LVRRERPSYEASGPNQLWSWDITYLRTPVRGVFSGRRRRGSLARSCSPLPVAGLNEGGEAMGLAKPDVALLAAG